MNAVNRPKFFCSPAKVQFHLPYFVKVFFLVFIPCVLVWPICFVFGFTVTPKSVDSTHGWNLECVEWNRESVTIFNVFKECFCSITLNACIYSKNVSCQGKSEKAYFRYRIFEDFQYKQLERFSNDC